MLIATVVTGCHHEAGRIDLDLQIVTDQGHGLSTSVQLISASSAQQVSNTIEQAAKESLRNTFGVTVVQQDIFRLFGAAS